MLKALKVRSWLAAAALALLAFSGVAQQPATVPGLNPALPLTHVENGPNSATARKAHYVVLVSLDGFRWDYARRDNAANLLALGKQGVWAPEGMLPSFPSLTFPNHFTLVTGLYPEHHGLVANSFYDAGKNARYAIADAAAVTDGSWYSGTPIWSLAESQGMRTACLFWPGSEAKIAGFRPSFYAAFDSKTETSDQVNQARVDNLVALLKLPEADRPHLITVYFSQPDHEGHAFGPDAPETHAATLKMDGMVGKIKAALDSTKLPIDLVVLSDHGMVRVEDRWIALDKFASLEGFDNSGFLLYGKTEADRDRLYSELKKNAPPEFSVYRLAGVPKELHYNENPRAGDPVIVPNGPYSIRARSSRPGKADSAPIPGQHGFNVLAMPEMKASFFAAGPDIVAGKTVAPFENVNVYPWLAHLLGLKAPATDGKLGVLAPTLRDGGKE